MKRLPSLDGLRAISIVLVVIAHSRFATGFPQGLKEIAGKGAVGVVVFFVISGFLITSLLLAEQAKTGGINIKAFYTRRIFRILPVYFLYILFILLWANIEYTGTTINDVVHLLTFTVNFSPPRTGFFGHFWTLSVEEQFYLVWPAVLILFRKHLKVVLSVLIIYSWIVRIIVLKIPGTGLITLAPFFAYSDAIVIGSLGAIIFFENPAVCRHRLINSNLAQLIAVAIFSLFLFLNGYPSMLAIISVPFGNTIISLCVLFLIFGYIMPSEKALFKLLNNKVVVHIGVLSYSIYIWQQFFDSGNGNMHAFWRTIPFNIILIYGVSLASYYLWERPFLKSKKRFSMVSLQPKINA